MQQDIKVTCSKTFAQRIYIRVSLIFFFFVLTSLKIIIFIPHPNFQIGALKTLIWAPIKFREIFLKIQPQKKIHENFSQKSYAKIKSAKI